MRIKQFKLYYNIFIASEKKWQLPKKAQILIYDSINKEILKPYLKKYTQATLALRGEFINIPCLILATLKWSFWKGNVLNAYIDSYIERVEPIVVITLVDNNKRFYSISKRFPKLKTIFLQNGLRTKSGDIFGSLSKSDNYHVDYMLVTSEAIGKYYLNFLSGEYNAVGTLGNNGVIRPTNIKATDILFISQLNNNIKDDNTFFIKDDGTSISSNTFFSTEIKVLKLLAKWCFENNKQLKICGREKINNNNEKYFYINYLKGSKCVWEYIPRKSWYSSYNLIDKAHIVISIDSTLGYEAIARGKRTAFFSCRGDDLGDTSYRFGWPLKLPDSGPIWTNKQDDLGLQLPKIMNYLNAISDNEWTKVCQNYKNLVMEFDPGNTRFVKLLNQLLSGKEIKNYVN